jgi:CheY-like chemotaxis protein
MAVEPRAYTHSMPKSVLVADDSLTIRKVIGMVLPQEDFQLTLVDNGLEAIQRARDLRPDVVLADVMMPGKSGYDVCQTLKSDPNTSHIPVLLLAGTFEPFDENRARASGADAHIVKPFESQAFIDKVRVLVGMAPGQAMIPSYGSVSTAPVQVAARPAAPPPSVGGPMPGARPAMPHAPGAMPGGMQGRPMGAPPGAMPPMGMQGRPGVPPGTVPGMRNPMMQGGPGMPPQGMPMARPPGSIPPGTVPGMRNPMMQGGPGMPPQGMPMARPPMGPGGPGPGGFPRPPGGPMPGAGVPPRRDPFGLGGPAPMQGRPPPGPPPPQHQQHHQHESLSLDGDGGEAALRNALSKASKEVIEKIAWEVVPQLAETIIREELDRLIKDRETKH